MTMELLLGIIAGAIFGFLLQKAEVLRFEKQVGFLCFKDMTIIKFMLSAIIVGYCPGTSVGALAEGRLHAVWAIVGMLFGAAVFSRAYPFIKENVLTWGSLGKVTIPQIVHLNVWIVIAIFTVIILLLFKFISKKGL